MGIVTFREKATNRLNRLRKKQDMNADATAQLLCVNCRCAGHVLEHCSIPWPGKGSQQIWSHSAHRAELIERLMEECPNELCNRCQELDILSMFEGDLQWKTPHDLGLWQLDGSVHHRNLGPAGTTEFHTRCPMCICLFALAPNPASKEKDFHIIADWTIHRVERLAHLDLKSRGRYDKCIMVQTCTEEDVLQLGEHLGDALCLKRNGEQHHLAPLGVREIQRDQLDINLMLQYVSACARLHPLTCSPRQSDELRGIKLVDVQSRTIVPYLGQHCEYLTLSYVWGEVDAFRYVKDDGISDLPKTIEDAMVLTSMLGKRYLWVDLFCVDQVNEAERKRQIQKMSSIYSGAFASIVAMSGTTMESGLTRMPGTTRKSQPQLSCHVQDCQLIGVMPTLSQQIHNSKWGTRAWTLQEAVLSPRCFYLTDHQVYFECNAMQCCESLDERSSWIHESFRDLQAIKSDPDGKIHGHGTLRKTPDGNGRPKDHLEIYGTLTALYSIRDMTDPNDVINAYTGITQHLTSLAYPEGFFWGLPISTFDLALLWCHPNYFARRPGKFPAWSWVGWVGQVFPFYPGHVDDLQLYSTHLFVWAVDNGKLRQLHPTIGSEATKQSGDCKTLRPFEDATIFDEIENLPLQHDIRLADFETKEAGIQGYLLLECAVCRLEVTYIEPHTYWSHPPFELYDVIVNQVPCVLKTTPEDFTCKPRDNTVLKNLALIARIGQQGQISLYFLQVYFDMEDGSMAYGSRTGRVFELMVPPDGVDVFQAFDVQRVRIIMT